MPNMVIILAVDQDETTGYAVIDEDDLNSHEGDMFALFSKDSPTVIFNDWDAAFQHVTECGVLVDVLGSIAY